MVFKLALPRPAFLPDIIAMPEWLQCYQQSLQLLGSPGQLPSASQEYPTQSDDCYSTCTQVAQNNRMQNSVNDEQRMNSVQPVRPATEDQDSQVGQDIPVQIRQPFEMEADLTENFIVGVKGGITCTPLRRSNRTRQDPERPLQRRDFADLTAVTIPGGDSSAADSPLVLAKAKNKGTAKARNVAVSRRQIRFASPLSDIRSNDTHAEGRELPSSPSYVPGEETDLSDAAAQGARDIRKETEDKGAHDSATQSKSATDSEQEDEARPRVGLLEGHPYRSKHAVSNPSRKRLRRMEAGRKIQAIGSVATDMSLGVHEQGQCSRSGRRVPTKNGTSTHSSRGSARGTKTQAGLRNVAVRLSQ